MIMDHVWCVDSLLKKKQCVCFAELTWNFFFIIIFRFQNYLIEGMLPRVTLPFFCDFVMDFCHCQIVIKRITLIVFLVILQNCTIIKSFTVFLFFFKINQSLSLFYIFTFVISFQFSCKLRGFSISRLGI